jgi:hypothetical protein
MDLTDRRPSSGSFSQQFPANMGIDKPIAAFSEVSSDLIMIAVIQKLYMMRMKRQTPMTEASMIVSFLFLMLIL